MNRALVFGITLFLAVVGFALLSTGTGSTAQAGHCCGSCHGCGGGCHGGLFHHHHGCCGCQGYTSCCGAAPVCGCCGTSEGAGAGPPPPPPSGGGGKAPPPPPPTGDGKSKAELAPLGFRTVSFQR